MKNLMIKTAAVLLLLFGLVPGGVRAEPEKAGKKENKIPNPGLLLLDFYAGTISRVDGDRCPSYPTCSAYGRQAIRKHGFFIGWMMTVDRLIHEGSEETRVSPYVFVNGKWKIYDPVENNDFWWYQPEKRISHE